MKIKLLDGSECEGFYGGWFPFMREYVGTVISNKQQYWDRPADNLPKYEEHNACFEVWLPNGDKYYILYWDRRCVEIMEGENEDE